METSAPLRLIAAPFTAFAPDGTLALDTIPEQLKHLRATGVAGAFVCGTTGECGSLTLEEREQVAERWATEAPKPTGASPAGADEPAGAREAAESGGFDVIVHVGHHCLADAKRLAAHAERLNVAGIAAVGPYYHRPGDIGSLVEFCAQVAQSAPTKPFFYYHIPSLTGVRFPMDEFLVVASRDIPTFAGLKFTHSDFGELARCLDIVGKNPGHNARPGGPGGENSRGAGGTEIFFGRDETLLSALALGVTSAVGSTYNFAAPLYLGLNRALRAGDTDTARHAQGVTRRMIETASGIGGQSALKALAGMVGPDLGPCRSPLPTLDDAQRTQLRTALEADGFFSALTAYAGDI